MIIFQRLSKKSENLLYIAATHLTPFDYLSGLFKIKKIIGQSPGEYIQTLVRKNYKIDSFLARKENLRECQTIHSSPLSKIFFDTLDEFDCYKDPFSILK